MSSLVKCIKCGQEFLQSSNNESYCPTCMIGFYEDEESLVKIPNKGSEININPEICCICHKELECPTMICEECFEKVYKEFLKYTSKLIHIDFEANNRYLYYNVGGKH